MSLSWPHASGIPAGIFKETATIFRPCFFLKAWALMLMTASDFDERFRFTAKAVVDRGRNRFNLYTKVQNQKNSQVHLNYLLNYTLYFLNYITIYKLD